MTKTSSAPHEFACCNISLNRIPELKKISLSTVINVSTGNIIIAAIWHITGNSEMPSKENSFVAFNKINCFWKEFLKDDGSKRRFTLREMKTYMYNVDLDC